MDTAVKVKDRWHQLADAIKASNLPPSDRHVFRFLLDNADYVTAEMPAMYTPTQQAVAKGTGLSLRQVKYSLAHLRHHGWLEVTGQASRGHRRRYALDHGWNCGCTGRRHERVFPERGKGATEPRKGAASAPERVQPTSATPQVTPPVALRGRERRKKEEPQEHDQNQNQDSPPPETDHRYDPLPGQFICRHCGRQWSRHEYRPPAREPA